ncbi:hypothetical protein MBANPS3_006127 [Mucor bainieri]
MGNPCPALPQELWIHILNQVQDKPQLATCRLVCKQWNPIAEKAMFSQTLEIKADESFVTKLHYHLSKKPALALSIKDIYLNSDHGKSTLLYKELLKLVVTPNLEEVRGVFHSKMAGQQFHQIIVKSPRKFNKIRRIPITTPSDLHTQCLYALKDSLQILQLVTCAQLSNTVLHRLNEFTKLFLFDLSKPDIQDILELDTILSRLQSATELELDVGLREQGFIPKSNDQMKAWLTQNVEIDEKITSIRGLSCRTVDHWCNLTEYLAYKYPNLQSLTIGRMLLSNDIERILEAIEHVPSVNLLESNCTSPEHLWTAGYLMKTSTNTIDIKYSSALGGEDGEDNAQCQIEEIWRDDETASSEFIVKLRQDAPHTYIKQLLSSVGSGTSAIIDATVDLFYWRDQDTSQELLTFYDILKLTPDIQYLTFSDATIRYQDLDNEDLALNDLEALDIVGAEIDHRVITQLGSIAPNLDVLKISSSLVVGREEKFAIIMPHSNIFTLMIQDRNLNWGVTAEYLLLERSDTRKVKLNEKKMDIDEIMYLCIKTELFPVKYYALKPDGGISTTAISEEEFNLHATASRTVLVEYNLHIAIKFENGVLYRSVYPFAESYTLKLEKKLHDLERQVMM